MFDPRDARWRRAVWLAAVGGPVGFVIARLSDTGEFAWPVALAIIGANIGAAIPRPGPTLGLVIGTIGGIVYLAGGVVGYTLILVHTAPIGLGDTTFWAITGVSATVTSLAVAAWVTCEGQLW